MPKLDSTQPYHFFATTAICWETATTRAEAIRKVIKRSGKYVTGEYGGIYVGTVRVEEPQSAKYAIEYYNPVGVKCTEALSGHFKVVGKTVVQLVPVED